MRNAAWAVAMVVLAGLAWWLWPAPVPPTPIAPAPAGEAQASEDQPPSDAGPRVRSTGGVQRVSELGVPEVDEPTPTSGMVSGVVRTLAELSDAGRQPLAGALVRLVRSPSLHPERGDPDTGMELAIPRADAEQVTETDGAFAFGVGPDESWWLTVTRKSYEPATFHGEGPTDLGEIDLDGCELQRVRVVGARRNALPDAVGLAYSDRRDRYPVVRVEADERGFVEVPKLPGGALFTAPGHAWTFARSSATEVRLSPGFDTGGRVIDDEGTPLSGVRITLEEGGFQGSVVTGADGRFHFERVAAVEYTEAVFVYGSARVNRPLPPGDLDITVTLPRRGDITGVVVYPDGAPAVDALVDGRPVDGDGRFTLWTDGSVRTHQIRALVIGRVEGFAKTVRTHDCVQQVLPRPGRTVDGLRLVLEETPYSFVRLRARTPGGEVIENLRFSVTGNWTSQAERDGVTTFAVGLAPGVATTAHLFASPATGNERRRVVVRTTARPDDPPTELELRPSEPVTLRLLDVDGEEIPRGEWTSLTVGALGNGRVSVTDDQRLDGAPGMLAKIAIEARGRWFFGTRSLPHASPFELVVQFPKRVDVAGRLVHADGRPMAEPVAILRQGPGENRALIEPDGSFRIHSVAVGHATIWVHEDRGRRQVYLRRFTVEESGPHDLGEIVVWERVELTGRVLVPPDVSAAGLRVEIEWADGANSRACITDPDGRFSGEVPGDAVTVISVKREGRLFGIVRADLTKTTEVVLSAQPVGRVRVHIPPAWGRRCDLWLGTADGSLRWETETDELDDRSTLILHNAPSGRVAVHAIVDGDETTRVVDVRPGSETTVDFR